MSADEQASADAAAGGNETPGSPVAAGECTPCRGTGLVISGAGGEQSTARCPWCEGSGRFIAEHDAQALAPEPPVPAAGDAPNDSA